MHSGISRPCHCREIVTLIGGMTVLLGGAIPLAAQQPGTTVPLVFDGATVVDVDQGRLLPDQRVVVVGNRIQTVAASSAVKLPPGAQVVDAKGKYLIPGLWDLHVHPDTLAPGFYQLFISQGVTGIRDAYAFIALETQVKWWHEIMQGTRVGPPRQLLTGAPISEFAGHPVIAPSELGVAEVKTVIDSLRKLGANFIKLYPFEYRGAAAARQLGIQFGGHVHGEHTAQEASDSGMSIIDHLNSSGGLGGICSGDEGTVAGCQEVTNVFKRNGTWWAPTLIIHARHNSFLDRLALGVPLFERMAAAARHFWSGGKLPRQGWLRDSTRSGYAQRPGLRADSVGFMRIAQRTGMPILTATDNGSPDVRKILPGFSLHTELAMLVAEGLTPLNALQAATLNPAKLIHGTDSLGTVAPGKLADLVLLDANPLDDITNTTMIRAVVANGRYFDRATLDQLLATIDADHSLLVRWEADTASGD